MYYVVMPKALAYPEEIEFPSAPGGEDERVYYNSSEFRNPRAAIQEVLCTPDQYLNIYNNLDLALANRPVSSEYVAAVMCLSASDLKSFDWVVCAPGLIKLKAGVEAPKIKSIRFCYDHSDIADMEPLQVIIKDDYTAIWQSTYTPQLEKAVREDALIEACAERDLAKITQELGKLPKDARLSLAPLLTLFAGRCGPEDAVAMTLILLQGRHPYLYMNEVYQALCDAINSSEEENGAYEEFPESIRDDGHGQGLRWFLWRVEQMIAGGYFSDIIYMDFLARAAANDVEGCNDILEAVCAKYDMVHNKAALTFGSIDEKYGEFAATSTSPSTITIESGRAASATPSV